MTRQLRQQSSTGIHHVMLRGINRQIMFENDDDYRKFIFILHDLVAPKDQLRRPLPPRCAIYAYCLMTNHVHLLIQEKDDKLPNIIRDIASRYAMYYNNRYEHFGHLFQDRYKSEPVNDAAYFLTLIRYIHQNPVAGGLSNDVKSYDWSSWREFTADPKRVSSICAVPVVLKRFPLEDLRELVNTPLPKTLRVLEYDNQNGTATDEEVKAFLSTNYGIIHPADLTIYAKSRRDEILKAAKRYGASIRQLSRLTSIGYSIIQKA